MKLQSELSKRVITGVLGAALLVSLIVFGGIWAIRLITFVVTMGMVYEFTEITFVSSDKKEKKWLMLILATGISFVAGFVSGVAIMDLIGLLFLVLAAYFLFSADKHGKEALLSHTQELMLCMTGLIYLVVLPLYLPLLRLQNHGVHWVILFFLIVWSGDTGAYFVGKKFGKHKLYPLISPKKSVEGALGGLSLSIVIALAYSFVFGLRVSATMLVITSILVNVISQIGDLSESLLKRAFDKKDSGAILPGHGGFLDRFDGVVFGLPVMYWCIRALA